MNQTELNFQAHMTKLMAKELDYYKNQNPQCFPEQQQVSEESKQAVSSPHTSDNSESLSVCESQSLSSEQGRGQFIIRSAEQSFRANDSSLLYDLIAGFALDAAPVQPVIGGAEEQHLQDLLLISEVDDLSSSSPLAAKDLELSLQEEFKQSD